MAGVEGQSHVNRSLNEPMYLTTGDPGVNSGNTITGQSTGPSIEQYENIFGPVARDIKQDSQRHKRHQRWHLPDVLKGPNPFLTDRVDGLITDATSSPFTRNILPYVYLESPDQKLKWNVYSFDEGIASRVPYEAAARVLPQTKRSFAGYVVRQGLAIAMEHNFMMSQKGQENFKNQLLQLVGSIQMTNDLDVHVALLTAPSYQRQQNEKYVDSQQSLQKVARRYVDMFGIMQKIPNALDFLIEDTKQILKTWGSQPPTFCLCNGKIQTQLTMLPERTNYLTNGPDGLKRLAQGPELPSYRGLSFINSRKFSMDTGTAPRDLLRRRVRVAEYYMLDTNTDAAELYDQSQDSFFTVRKNDCFAKTMVLTDSDQNLRRVFNTQLKYMKDNDLLDYKDPEEKDVLDFINDTTDDDKFAKFLEHLRKPGRWWKAPGVGVRAPARATDELRKTLEDLDRQIEASTDDQAREELKGSYDDVFQKVSHTAAPTAGAARGGHDICILLRPNIEHEMLAVVFGRGGTQELGCTFWGQTELSCYDDAQHGIWGMSYKYHERAIVTNERNLVRVYDVAFDGYNGGMDKTMLDMNDDDDLRVFKECTMDKGKAYVGKSIVPFRIPYVEGCSPDFCSPVLLSSGVTGVEETENKEHLRAEDIDKHYVLHGLKHWTQKLAWLMQWQRLGVHHWIKPQARATTPGDCCISGDAAQICMAFHGTMKPYKDNKPSSQAAHHGSGHLGYSYAGVASVREGRGRIYSETMGKDVQLYHSV